MTAALTELKDFSGGEFAHCTGTLKDVVNRLNDLRHTSRLQILSFHHNNAYSQVFYYKEPRHDEYRR
jgi:hypothetical protein